MTTGNCLSYTVCTASFLPQAKVLADSLVRTNPGHRFVIVLLDRQPEVDDRWFLPHRIVDAASMGIPAFPEMNARFTPYDLCNAMRSEAARWFLANDPACEKLFYLDADILALHRMTVAERLLDEHPILLTPHLATTREHEGRMEQEELLLHAGVFNSGFLGLRRSEETTRFLAWWASRKRFLYARPANVNRVVEQLLLQQVPALFPGAGVLRDTGYNVAYWNLGERRVSRRGDAWVVDGERPLVLFHFSGHEVRDGAPMTRFTSPISFETRPELIPLFEDYRRAVRAADPCNLRALPPRCGRPAPVVRPSVGQRIDAWIARFVAPGRKP